MNAIQLQSQIDLYLDTTRNARFERWEYDHAVNNAIRQFVENILDKRGIETTQSVSDDLYTLYKTQSAAPTSDVALYPNDYLHLVSLYATIGGTEYYCKPTTHGQLGPLKLDSFRRPSDTKPYYTQEATGFLVYHGSGTVTSCKLNYYKTPASYSVGKDSQLIDAGGTLTNALTYYATAPSVYNGTSYNIGDSITGTGAALTSGQCILSTNTTACDLPGKVQEAVAQSAAKILSGAVQNFNPSAFSEKQAEESGNQ